MSRPVHEVPGVHGPVRVRFDDHDRPLIDATTWVDAAAGLGWSVARHRGRQLDVLRRTTQGRLAEVLGPAAVTSDLRCRTLDLAGVAERCLELLPEDQRQLLDAFAHGVSAGLDPADEPWRPLDSISVAQLLFDQLSFDGGEHRMVEVLDRTLPRAVVDFLLTADDDYATDLDGRPAPPVGPELPLAELRALVEASGDGDPARLVVRELRATGSNAWAVSDGETATLANDMHLALTVPALWYAAVLRVGDRTVTGVTVPGLPVIVAGTNQRVAWGFTRLAADTADLVELRPGRTPDSFRDPSGGDRPFDTRVETIAVLDADPVRFEARRTPWGPVVGLLAGRPLVVRSALCDPAALDFASARLYRADTAAEAVDIVTSSGLPPVNAVIAADDGTIAWTVGGRLPRRGGRPTGVVTDPAGDTGPDRWLTPDEHPRTVQRGGVVLNANNGNPLVRGRIGWNFVSGVRAHRIACVLADREHRDAADSLALQLDTDAGFYAFYRDLVRTHLPRPVRGALGDARAEVLRWRGTSDTDETGLALLVVFRDCVREAMFAAVTRPAQGYDPEFTYCYNGHEQPLRHMLTHLDDGLTPPPWRDARHFVAGQLLLARRMLTHRTGTDQPVRWGQLNRLRPLGFRPDGSAATTGSDDVELAGCTESVRVTQPDFGAALRLVVTLGRRTGGLLSIPGSQQATGEAEGLRRWAAGHADPLPGHG